MRRALPVVGRQARHRRCGAPQPALAGAWPWVLAWLGLLCFISGAHADELPEYRLKAAFVYNFALYIGRY